MLKNHFRAFTLLLAVVMVFSLAVPAFAASGQVNVTFADGSTTTLVNTANITLHTIGETDVDTVTVGDGVITDTYTDFSTTIDKTLTGGTRYQLFTQTDSSGVKTLRFRYLNSLNDNISISVSAKATTYTVNANSGALNQNGNQGGAATCTANLSASTQVSGGGSYSVTFTPKAGQEIAKLNLRTNAADASGKLVDAAAGSVVINGQTFYVSLGSNGKVTVRAEPVVRNLFITALTRDETSKYTLSASTDGNCVADVGTETVSAGTAKNITFTPDAGFIVTEFTITDGASHGTLSLNNTAVTVNGHRYSVTRKLDGSAVFAVPAMSANVSVAAVAASDVHYVRVLTDNNVNSNRSGVNYVKTGDAFEFYYTPSNTDVALHSVSISTASAGTRVYALNDGWVMGQTGTYFYTSYDGTYGWVKDSTGNYVFVPYGSYGWVQDNNGNYVYVPAENWATGSYLYASTESWFNGTYWEQFSSGEILFHTDSANRLYIRINNVTENIEVKLNNYDTAHQVTVTGDPGVSFDQSSYKVAANDNLDLVFKPSGQTFAVQSLLVTTNTGTFRLNVRDGYTQAVNGSVWSIAVASDGTVTLHMVGVCCDTTVRGESNYVSSREMTVTKSCDAHSAINITGSNPASSADTVFVDVAAIGDYELEKVTFRVGSDSVVITPSDQTLTIAGCTYDVKWNDSGSMSVAFDPLPGSMSVACYSKQTDSAPAPESTLTPTLTTVYHPAFMVGVGNGKFEPSRALTRAEAVVLLNRSIHQVSDADVESFKNAGSFVDVPSSFWGAGAIYYAKAQNLLPVLTTNSVFQPNTYISRAQFVTLLCAYRKADVSSVSTTSIYSDVPPDHWAIKYINYAASQGWVNGVGNSQFEPNRAVTRAEICAMINRILGRTIDQSVAIATGATFMDVPITHWAFSDIFEASRSHYAVCQDGGETWILN